MAAVNAPSASALVEQVVEAGAQEAASALGRLLRVAVHADAATHLDLRQLSAAHGPRAVVIAFQASGGVAGTLVLVVDDAVAGSLAGRLTGPPRAVAAGQAGSDDTLGVGGLGALAELGNIVASAFLNGAARVVGRTCLPSVPRLVHDVTADAVASVLPVIAAGSVAVPVATLRLPEQSFSLVFAAS